MTQALVCTKIVGDCLGRDPVFLAEIGRWPERALLTIDSRDATPKSIFFAIKGELADGHDFIETAFMNGAVLAVAQKNHPLTNKLPHKNIIWVDDPLKTFSLIARDHLRSMPARKIALTGSNGKTTTKEMIKSALCAVMGSTHIFASAGNKNNHFGVPLSALQVGPEHRMAVFEMGMNHPGEIAHLCAIVEPELALITNISMAHEGCFPDGIEGVQAAKGEIFDAVNAQGLAVVNCDDARVWAEASKRTFRGLTTFGYAQEADVKIVSRQKYCLDSGLQKIVIEVDGHEHVEVSIPLPGLHQASNAAAALAVIHALGLPVAAAALGLARMHTTQGRLSMSRHPGGYIIVNDGYNANPASMKAGVAAVLELPAKRRIAVIGAMGELGVLGPRYHFELGELLAQNFQHLLICGPDALPVVAGAQSKGMAAEHIIYEPNSQQLINPLNALVAPGDVVFIKGSLSANMAVVAQALAAS